jgi:hypothetical protein
MKTSALLISVFICGYVIFFTELARKEIAYDCRVLIGGWHPDIPQQVIKQCKGLI